MSNSYVETYEAQQERIYREPDPWKSEYLPLIIGAAVFFLAFAAGGRIIRKKARK